MADFTLNQLPPAQTPLLDEDRMIITRNGTTLNQLTLQQLAQYVNTEGDPGNVVVSLDNTSNTNLFVGFFDTTAGRQFPKASTNFKFVPATGTLIANAFSGSGSSLSALNANNITQGTLSPLRGGTGATTAPTTGQILVGLTAGTYAPTTISANNGIVVTAGSGSLSITSNATSLNTFDALVKRDSNGDFSAGIITANLVGNVTGNVSGSAGSTSSINLQPEANAANIVRFTFADTFGASAPLYTDDELTYNRSTGIITTRSGAIGRTPSIESNDVIITQTPTNLDFSGNNFSVTSIGGNVTITSNKHFSFSKITLRDPNSTAIDFIAASKFNEELYIKEGLGIQLTKSPTPIGMLDSYEFVITNSDRGSTAVSAHTALGDPHPQYLLRSDFNGGGGGTGNITISGNTGTVMSSSFDILGQNGIIVTAMTPNDINITPSFGTPVTLFPEQANSEGMASSFARSDHVHSINTDAPVGLGYFYMEGMSTSFARADHVHQVPDFLEYGSPNIVEADVSFNFATRSTTIDPRATYTRSSSARFRNRFGKHVLVNSDIPRFEYSHLNRGQLLGLLLEGSSKNYAFPSESHVGYTKTGIVAVDTTDTQSPLESNAIIGITQSTGTSFHELSKTITDAEIASFANISISFFVRSMDSNLVRIRYGTSSVIFSLMNGMIVGSSGPAALDVKLTIEKGDFYRVGLEFARQTTHFIGLSVVETEMQLGEYEVTTPISYDISGIQFEAHNETHRVYSSYISTTTVAVARAGDSLVIPSSLAKRVSDSFGFYIHVRAADNLAPLPKYSSGIRLLNSVAPSPLLIESYVYSEMNPGTKITYNGNTTIIPLSNVMNLDLGGPPLRDIQTFVVPNAFSTNGIYAMSQTPVVSDGNIELTNLFSHLVELRVYHQVEKDIPSALVSALTSRGA